MSAFILGLLTLFLILNCLLLILLVLVQLPKKDAGAGLAFGSGAADALFGAGSGNALTKITKYATIIFLVMSWFLGLLWDKSAANAPTVGSWTPGCRISGVTTVAEFSNSCMADRRPR